MEQKNTSRIDLDYMWEDYDEKIKNIVTLLKRGRQSSVQGVHGGPVVTENGNVF